MLKTFGKYEILRLLGKGTMGEVYLGRDTLLGRNVAIKTIQFGTDFDGEGEARFEREARAMAAMNHPNIISIYDFGTVEGARYLAMEFLEGEDLETLIKKGGYDKAELLEALAQACDGLGYAHSRGIIHRDVKPGNILVGRGGGRPLAKLLDFGVASVDRSNLTEQGIWMGTVSYMAPEYLDSGKATRGGDIFAAGVIIYEILSGGRKPFPGESTTGVLTAILYKPADRITPADAQGVPPPVLEVMTKAMAKDPARRYGTAEELASALREALAAPMGETPELAPQPEARQRIVVGRGGGATCLSLRVALRLARPGALVVVQPGHYREVLRVDMALTLQGEGDPAAIILEAPSGACLTVAGGPGVEVLNLTLRGEECALDLLAGQSTLDGCVLGGVRVQGGAEASLVSCSVLQAGRAPAVLAEAGASVSLSGTTLRNPQGTGLCLRPGARITAEDTWFEDNPAGSVELGPGSTSRFLRCSFLRSRFAGVLALEGATATLEDCILSGHEGAGIHVMGGSRVSLAACRILENRGMGVSVVDSGQVVLRDCEISRNGEPGLLLDREGAASLARCRVVDGMSLGIACHRGGVLVLEHSQVRGNALGGLLLGPEAGPPELGEGNELLDPVLR